MWNKKCVIMELTIGTFDKVTKVVKKTLEAKPGNHSTDSLQKTAKLGTSRIMQTVLSLKHEA